MSATNAGGNETRQLDLFGGGGGRAVSRRPTLLDLLDELATVFAAQGKVGVPINVTWAQFSELRAILQPVTNTFSWRGHPIHITRA
jgi:hypothetical protein